MLIIIVCAKSIPHKQKTKGKFLSVRRQTHKSPSKVRMNMNCLKSRRNSQSIISKSEWGENDQILLDDINFTKVEQSIGRLSNNILRAGSAFKNKQVLTNRYKGRWIKRKAN